MIADCDRALERLCFLLQKLLFSLGYHNSGNSVSDHIGDGPGFTHKFINAQQERQAFERDLMDRCERGSQNHKATPRNAGRPFGSEHQYPYHPQLFHER